MKRVLVTGAGGFVGARILDMWRGQFALCAFPSDTLRTADENAVLRFILKEHPDVIVHTAAIVNATQSPAAGAVALVVGIAAAWFGASLFQVSVACCAVVFVLELFLVH